MSMRLTLSTFLMSFAILSLPAHQPTSSGQSAHSNQHQQPAPIEAAPEPMDPIERALRAERDRLQNEPRPVHGPTVYPGATAPPTTRRTSQSPPPIGPPSLVFVDRIVLPELPVENSDTIVLGSVTKIQP
jgi:hypothetical protein